MPVEIFIHHEGFFECLIQLLTHCRSHCNYLFPLHVSSMSSDKHGSGVYQLFVTYLLKRTFCGPFA